MTVIEFFLLLEEHILFKNKQKTHISKMIIFLTQTLGYKSYEYLLV